MECHHRPARAFPAQIGLGRDRRRRSQGRRFGLSETTAFVEIVTEEETAFIVSVNVSVNVNVDIVIVGCACAVQRPTRVVVVVVVEACRSAARCAADGFRADS